MFFLFIAGTWLLTPANLLFVFVYFFALTIYRFALIWVLSSLQELVVEVFSIRKLVVQLLVYLAMWLIVFPAYKKLYGHEPV